MSNYEFHGLLYRTQREMLDAIASKWLSADGQNDLAYQIEVVTSRDGDSLASECMRDWELGEDNRDPWDSTISHMVANDYDREDLAEAFERLRERLSKVEDK